MKILIYQEMTDLEVRINKDTRTYDAQLLASKSELITEFLARNPGKRFETEFEDIDARYVHQYLNLLCGNTDRNDGFGKIKIIDNSPWNFVPLGILMVADYFQVSISEIERLADYAKSHIKYHLRPFIENYQFPTTEPEIALQDIFKWTKNPKVCDVFDEVIDETDINGDMLKMAGCLHALVASRSFASNPRQQFVEDHDGGWVAMRIAAFDFPTGFCHKLNLPHYRDYLIEADVGNLIYDPWTNAICDGRHIYLNYAPINFRISKKYQQMEDRPEQILVPIDAFDREYLSILKDDRQMDTMTIV